MSGKYQKNTKRKKKKSGLPLILGLVILLLAGAIAAILFLKPGGKGQPGEESPAVSETAPADTVVVRDETVQIRETLPLRASLDNDLEILDIGSYTGAYVEDGSDEIVSGILMLKVRNNGENTVEYAKLTMDVAGQTAEFHISTLKPGATIVLQEKNRMAYDKNADYSAAAVVCENLALFGQPLNLYEDRISIQILDGAINVSNISQEDISGRISIYYKNTAAGVYYGGITYRVTLENGLKAGEVRQMMASHFSDTGSEILFITIAQ